MAPRLELQAILETVLGTDKVYFQPPSNLEMDYPCIVYKRDDANTNYANNMPYQHLQRYQIMVIEKNPDSLIPGKVAGLPTSSFVRHYVSKNLNHDVFTLFY